MFYGYRDNGGWKPTYQELTYKVLVRNSDVACLRMSITQAKSQEKGISGKKIPGRKAQERTLNFQERALNCLQSWKKAYIATSK